MEITKVQRSARAVLTDTDETIYEVPADHYALVANIIISNTSAEVIAVTVYTTDADDSPEEPYHLAKVAGIDAGDALTIAENVPLDAGDKVVAFASADDVAAIHVNVEYELTEPAE